MPKAAAESPYGLMAALREGGLISQTVFGILVIFLFFSLYILFTQLFEQQKIINQAKRVRGGFGRYRAADPAQVSHSRS